MLNGYQPRKFEKISIVLKSLKDLLYFGKLLWQREGLVTFTASLKSTCLLFNARTWEDYLAMCLIAILRIVIVYKYFFYQRELTYTICTLHLWWEVFCHKKPLLFWIEIGSWYMDLGQKIHYRLVSFHREFKRCKKVSGLLREWNNF